MSASKCRKLMIGAALAAIAFVAPATPSSAQQPLPTERGFGELLIKSAKASPGCLGIETGRTNSGALVIFAWFENKKALVDWYKSDFHQRAMKGVFPNQTFDREPVPDLPENSGQILALVTLRLTNEAASASSPLPIQTIGIELYTPLPGGVVVGGRFAPESVRIPGLRKIDLKIPAGPAR